ncbi:MAG: branched-chain amino acid aminotransferase [Clostridiales bacterium]|jgi:branched-chain amino acid aminotransferase|nr:branched-chain amino acid aminotransferase [Clostridiales bacterium]
MLNIKITPTQNKKEKPDQTKLGFGRYFTDHMFLMDYNEGQGWHDARIVPFENLSLSPATMVFHYAQEMFEGMKAYLSPEGKILLFRPDMNAKRLNRTNQRMIIPELPQEDFIDAVKAIVKYDADWIPTKPGTSLYIRPFIIATDPFLGVHPSESYLFAIILSPVGAYYASGINPVRIFVEKHYTRAVRGGTGYAKVGGNYACSLIGQQKAEEMGYAQVLWLDGIEHKYIDEVGAMNVFFVVDGDVLTPSLDEGSILPGVTRDSCIHLLKSWGYKVTERKISLEEIVRANDEGRLDEAFGTGTAAVISPIGELNDDGNKMILNGGKIGPVSQKLYDSLTAIQWGKAEGPEGWSVVVE